VGERTFTASLSQSQNRPGFSVIFRHPALTDEATGRPGRRVRRGLETKDQAQANMLLDQLRELLANPRYHSAAARADAVGRFDDRVLKAFFGPLAPDIADHYAIRERHLELPPRDGPYCRAMAIGTTAAGKTTVIRQLLGTDPKTERFPAVAPAKTTVHDTEVVLEDGPKFRGVVTFLSSDELRAYLSECISAAVLAAYHGADDSEVLRRLLNHVNQRHRFSYVLGYGPLDEDEDEAHEGERGGPRVDLTETNAVLARALESVRALGLRYGEDLRRELLQSEADQRVIDEIFEDELDSLLREDEEYHAVIDALHDEIEKRFELLDVGELGRTRQGWPLYWKYETDDRAAFLRAVGRFSSNYGPLFGTLLTPLVSGVRVAGPFTAPWLEEPAGPPPRLVLFDGEGLGHTPESAAALSTTQTRRIDEVDAVLLVDRADQPMQAAPVAAIRQLVASGNVAKLVVVFTHFDKTLDDSLPSLRRRKDHVLESAENVLVSLGESLGPAAERALRARLRSACFFLGNIHRSLDPGVKEDNLTIAALRALLEVVNGIKERPEPTVARPVYDRMNLALAVKDAAEAWRGGWLPLLGLVQKAGVEKKHWAKVRALSRRLATPGWTDEYEDLKPVASLWAELQAQIYVFLQKPLEWVGGHPTEDEMQARYDSLAENISRRMVELSSRRVRQERQGEWQNAYTQRGRGSSYARATIIADDVYDRAAPVPGSTPSPDRNQFLHQVSEEVQKAAEEIGADLR
jgi:hypothetical protein